MEQTVLVDTQVARKAALEVLLSNSRGPCAGLPRTAGWGYPEPYTRDLLICGLGIMVSGNEALMASLRTVLETLARNQSALGHMPSLIHDSDERGSSDSTPLFLLIAGIYRNLVNEPDFCAEAVEKALTWMEYQSDSDRVIVAQLPTSDWRDEQWVLGYGLFVNTIVLSYLAVYDRLDRMQQLKHQMSRLSVGINTDGFAIPEQPYYAMWSYKVYGSERFDLLGNSIAILSGFASQVRAQRIIRWIEVQCEELAKAGHLALPLPPNFFPYIQPGDPEWLPRYEKFNQPGEYHNGGIWPFVCGFYIAAIVAAGMYDLARDKLNEITKLVRPARVAHVEFGFNEWFRAQDGSPRGQDWQSWSAAMYLYASYCVERQNTPFFDQIRQKSWSG